MPKRAAPKDAPEPAEFCTADAAAEWVAAIKPARTNMLVFGPGTRNVCGEYRFVDLAGVLTPPRRGTQYFLAAHPTTGAPMPHGENTGMINDWAQDNAAKLVQVPGVARLLRAQYGPGWRLGLDRHSARDRPVHFDTPAKLLKTAHRDFRPDGTHERKQTWRPPADTFGGLPAVRCVETLPGHVSLAILNQSGYHGIPAGGRGFGVYLSGMSAADHAEYRRAWCARVRKELARGSTTPRTYVWPEFARLDPDDFEAMVLATVVYGLPPPVFPSGLPMNVPQPYAGAIFPHFAGVRPCATKQLLDPAAELAKARAVLPEAAVRALERVALALPGRWVASPAAVADAIAVLV